MKTYKSDVTRAVRAETHGDAAERIAGILARRKYGRRAVVGAKRQESHIPGYATYWSAFVGYRSHDGITGGDVAFSVYSQE